MFIAEIGGQQCAPLGTAGLRSAGYALCQPCCGVSLKLLPGLSPIYLCLCYCCRYCVIYIQLTHTMRPKTGPFQGQHFYNILKKIACKLINYISIPNK